MKVNNYIGINLKILFSIILIGLLFSCDDNMADTLNDFSEEVTFRATVGEGETVTTREREISGVYDINANDNVGYKDIDFYMYIDEITTGKKDFSVYWVPSGYTGILTPKDNNKSVNWFSRNNSHNFYSWTLPWDEKYAPKLETIGDPITINFKDTYISDFTSSSAKDFPEESWGNGINLEKFVGAVNGPLEYQNNGKYVKLQFRHLVSKIFLKSFIITDNANATSSLYLKGNITIYGLPKTATFYPVPKGNSDGSSKAPYVSMPEDFDYPQYEGVTFALTNEYRTYYWEGPTYNPGNGYYDCWYICPEVDLSKLSFKIEIWEYNTTTKYWQISTKHGNHGAFYGDFKSIELTRNDKNYDNVSGNDKTILHAGEYLILSMNLYSKGNPSVKGSIVSWNYGTSEGQAARNAYQHVKSGIYSIEELNDFYSIMSSGDEDNIKEGWDLYGSGEYTEDKDNLHDQKELGIIRIYDDITGYTSGLSIDDDYILDGMGHMITLTSSTSYNKYEINGHIRDVYIKHPSGGGYLIYIDPEGNIYKVDETTMQETFTEYNVNDVNKYPYYLDIRTGTITY